MELVNNHIMPARKYNIYFRHYSFYRFCDICICNMKPTIGCMEEENLGNDKIDIAGYFLYKIYPFYSLNINKPLPNKNYIIKKFKSNKKSRNIMTFGTGMFLNKIKNDFHVYTTKNSKTNQTFSIFMTTKTIRKIYEILESNYKNYCPNCIYRSTYLLTGKCENTFEKDIIKDELKQ